ncbi:EAL domain-containing protein [Clostridium sp.]|uniref:putative bifunctional diguanylate cyclase/phosphodiesterase n=1 Tax=Clostridium sp. TaxID=1506 RepID=UPI002FC8E272
MGSYRKIEVFEKDMGETIKELIKKQEELKRSEERYRIVAEATKDIIWEGDLINKKRFFSGKLYEVLGYNEKELENLDEWFNIVHPEDRAFVIEGIRAQIGEKAEFKTFEYRVKCKNGSYKWLSSNTKCEFNHKGEPISTFGAFTDITELKEHEKKIHDLAYYDSVTGLPNRAMLTEVIPEKIEDAHENNRKFSMIFMDLDNFKFVNDSYGHVVGDKLLVEVGKRLREMNSDKITSFRLGGDEFIVLIENIEDKDEVEQLSKYLHRVLASPFVVNAHMFRVTHSSGIVLYPENGDNFQELLKNADTAMYKSKELGKGTNSFYHVKMGEATKEKFEIEADLYKAIENSEFELYYQPIVDTAVGKIKGCEALIRWRHPKKGMVPPEKFISIAEENGTIVEIGKWVFESACEYAKRMHDSGHTDFYVSVNISPLQLLQNEFTDFVLNTIKKIGITPELLIIEITESVLIESMDSVTNKLKELKDNNIKIALDDFGCGYSSLTYLKTLPINIVKIDSSFIMDIQCEEDTKNMTNIIILMARQLGLNVIAEGVELKHHLNYLKKHGCDMFQGYLISKPVPEEEFDRLIKLQNACNL